MGTVGEVVPGEEFVTQLGYVNVKMTDWHRLNFSFRATLHAQAAETSMSVIHGRLSVRDVVPLVARGDSSGSADAVRYARVADLIKAGFQVTFEPTATIRDHVAVACDRSWKDDVPGLFSLCFSEYAPECGP